MLTIRSNEHHNYIAMYVVTRTTTGFVGSGLNAGVRAQCQARIPTSKIRWIILEFLYLIHDEQAACFFK